VQITATPQADPSKAATVPVTVLTVVHVSITPLSATLVLGGTQSFQASVSGARDSSVTWFVDGVVGGSATTGTIVNSQTNPDNTIYTAPTISPPGGMVTVLAESNADPSASASATIAIESGIAVSLSPSSATLAVNHMQTFTALASGTANQSATWQVNGIAGGNLIVGQICAVRSSPCQPVTATSAGSVEYIAPAGLPSPNPVTIMAASRADANQSASASITILPHVVVSVLPGSTALAATEEMRFAASVAGTADQQVLWSVTGSACANPAGCGSIDATGLFVAPLAAPSPNLIDIAATSVEDVSQMGTAAVTITSGPRIFSLAPTSAYEGSAGGFSLLVSGNNFSPSATGPGSTILVAGNAQPTSCASINQCTTTLGASELQSAGNVSVQLRNPDGTISNQETLVVLAPGTAASVIPVTPSAPTSSGNDIVVVELSTNGGFGAAGNVSLNVGATGIFSPQTASCVLQGSPVLLQRPALGVATPGLCLFSVSGLSPSFTYSLSGPAAPDVAIIGRQPLGLGILDLTLQLPATAAPGARTVFVENPALDVAAGTGVIEVR
jgi:hypothetical protein